jgi:hypothetical protein
MEERTYWLSFADHTGFLGVCIVDVDADDAEAERDWLTFKHPNHAPGAEWIGAAVRMAHLMGCNPGGAVQSTVIPSTVVGPRNRLLTREQALAVKKE